MIVSIDPAYEEVKLGERIPTALDRSTLMNFVRRSVAASG